MHSEKILYNTFMPTRKDISTIAEPVQSTADVSENPFAGLSEEGRIRAAIRLGLPENATWQTISTTQAQQSQVLLQNNVLENLPASDSEDFIIRPAIEQTDAAM